MMNPTKLFALGLAAALATPAAAQTAPPPLQRAPAVPNAAGVYALQHTHVVSADIDKTIHFYVDLLGFTVARPKRLIGKSEMLDNLFGLKGVEYEQAMLTMSGQPVYALHAIEIEIWGFKNIPNDQTLYNAPSTPMRGKGYNSYIVKDLEALLERLKADGVRVVSTGGIQRSPGLGRSVYVADPDGQVVELIQRDLTPEQQ
jgi:catechol 2,3-dioxygenase-like lactoylglutathione lyase family enzyme